MSGVVNAADEQQVADARLIEELTERQAGEDLREVLASDAGARLVLRILGVCGVDESQDYGENTHQAARAAGRRHVGVWLLAAINRDAPAEWLEVLQAKHRAEMKQRRSK